MTKSDSAGRPRLLLVLVFAVVFGLLLFNSIRLWQQIDVQERWARAAELLLVAVGAWAVVWPESFPPWRRSKGSSDPGEVDHHPKEGRAEPSAAADSGRAANS